MTDKILRLWDTSIERGNRKPKQEVSTGAKFTTNDQSVTKETKDLTSLLTS